jgi:hypothetical protein
LLATSRRSPFGVVFAGKFSHLNTLEPIIGFASFGFASAWAWVDEGSIAGTTAMANRKGRRQTFMGRGRCGPRAAPKQTRTFEVTSPIRARTLPPPVSLLAFYVLVTILGILSMGFQMLGSRLLSPHFGSSIDVWACLISTFLAAFSLGSMLGGWISNLPAAPRQRGQLICAVIAVLTLAITAIFGRGVLGQIEITFTSIIAGVLLSCLTLFFVPVTALSTFSPQCVQFLAQRGTPPGKASGLVYGVSTLGNIAGVMLTTFVLIAHFRVSTLLYLWLAVAILCLACLVRLLRASSSLS